MKKFFLISAAILVLLVLSACLGFAPKVQSLKFTLNEGAVAPENYSEAELDLVPDYENRSLGLNYSRVFPNRTSATLDVDVDTDGFVGGEYFDRFEKIVKIINKNEIPENLKEAVSEVDETFSANLRNHDGRVVEIKSFDGFSGEDFQYVQSFYLDLINLLTGDVQV